MLHLFLGLLLKVENVVLSEAVLSVVNIHLNRSNELTILSIEKSSFVGCLCDFMQSCTLPELRIKGLKLFDLLVEKITNHLFDTANVLLSFGNFAAVCPDSSGKTLLLINEIFLKLLYTCLKNNRLKELPPIDRRIYDFLIFRILNNSWDEKLISPGRLLIHQKAALASLLTLLSKMDDSNSKLDSNSIEALVMLLTTLLNDKRKTKEHFSLISVYLSILSTQNDENV